jgi:hypothetical protein
MKNKIRDFLVKINSMSTQDLLTISVMVAALPFVLTIVYLCLFKVQLPISLTGYLVIFIVMVFIFASLVMIIRREIPAFPPFHPITGKWAVVMGEIQAGLLIVFLVIVIKTMF